MRIVVHLFAIAKQTAGCDRVELDLPPGATVADLRRQLGQAATPLAPLMPQMLFALDAEFASDAAVIREQSRVACLPPVSGG